MLVSKHAALTANFRLNTFRDTPLFSLSFSIMRKDSLWCWYFHLKEGFYSDVKSLIIFDLLRVAFF